MAPSDPQPEAPGNHTNAVPPIGRNEHRVMRFLLTREAWPANPHPRLPVAPWMMPHRSEPRKMAWSIEPRGPTIRSRSRVGGAGGP